MKLRHLPLILCALLPSSTFAGNYGQALIHTADGGTYIVTTDDASLIYEVAPSGVDVICVTFNNAVGLPPATNDIIFRNGFEPVALCFE